MSIDPKADNPVLDAPHYGWSSDDVFIVYGGEDGLHHHYLCYTLDDVQKALNELVGEDMSASVFKEFCDFDENWNSYGHFEAKPVFEIGELGAMRMRRSTLTAVKP